MEADFEARYRALFEMTLEGILIVDDEGRYVDVNESMARLLKAPREQLIGRSFRDFVPPDRLEEAETSFFELRTAGTFTGRFPLRATDGRIVELEWSARAHFVPGLHFCVGRDVTEREQAEEEAERQREWLRATLFSIGDAVIATDRTGAVTFMNEVAEGLTGWTQGQAGSRPLEEVFQIVNEQTRKPVTHPVQKVLETGHVVGLANHTVLIARNGKEIPIDDSAAPIRDRAGAVAGVVLIFRDITERRRLEVAALRLAAVVEFSDDVIVSKDLNGIVTSWNPAAERIFGYSVDEMVGQPITVLVPPERAHEEEEILARLRRGERLDHFETVRVRKDGTRLDVSVSTSPIKDAEGHVIGASKIARDITGQKRAVLEAARLAAVVESSADAIISQTLDGTISSWNEAAERMYGYTAEEIVGRPLSVLTPPEAADEMPGMLERLKRGERIEHYETVRVRKDGVPVNVSLSISPIRDASGQIVGASKIARDIGTEKALREELERRVEELAEADRRKDQFLAMLAHELRNPLGAISTAVHVLQQPEGTEAARQRALQVLRRQVQHQARMVNELLDVSRITRGLIDLYREPLDLARLVREAVEDYRAALEQERIGLHLELPESPLSVMADATRLAQVVSNLLSNALKFTPAGGRVTVTVGSGGWGVGGGGGAASDRSDRSDRSEVTSNAQRPTPNAQPPTPAAVLTVSDTGIGIEPELLPFVFESFSQGDRTLARSRGGLGLGLAIVKGLVELHGGTVSAESAGQGQGTTIRVALPLYQTPAAAPRERGAALSETQPLRVLVVEDNRDAAEMLKELLEMHGYEVEIALTGPEGVRAARSYHPDVVLCDIGLPGMDGYEVAAALRSDPGGARQRLVAVTGYGQDEDRRRSREAGFQYHLVKPVDPEELREILMTLADDMTA